MEPGMIDLSYRTACEAAVARRRWHRRFLHRARFTAALSAVTIGVWIYTFFDDPWSLDKAAALVILGISIVLQFAAVWIDWQSSRLCR
jgi:hypothetical protein